MRVYISKCHKSKAVKPPCGTILDGKNKQKTGLGHWRCGHCNQLCAVTVKVYSEAESRWLS